MVIMVGYIKICYVSPSVIYIFEEFWRLHGKGE